MPQRLLTEVFRVRGKPGRPAAQEGGLNYMGHLGCGAPTRLLLFFCDLLAPIQLSDGPPYLEVLQVLPLHALARYHSIGAG